MTPPGLSTIMARRIREVEDPAARVATRARLEPLRRFRAGASSHAQYLFVALRFQAWLDALQYLTATDKHFMDRQQCAYIENLWLNGEGKSVVGDTIPAVQFFIVRRRVFQGAWSLHGAWGGATRYRAAQRHSQLKCCWLSGVWRLPGALLPNWRSSGNAWVSVISPAAAPA